MKLNSTTMKKVLMLFAALLLTLTASAQFEEGKKYVGASLSGLDLSYNGSKELALAYRARLVASLPITSCFMEQQAMTMPARMLMIILA